MPAVSGVSVECIADVNKQDIQICDMLKNGMENRCDVVFSGICLPCRQTDVCHGQVGYWVRYELAKHLMTTGVID